MEKKTTIFMHRSTDFRRYEIKDLVCFLSIVQSAYLWERRERMQQNEETTSNSFIP